MGITRQKGTRDIYGENISKIQFIEENVREVCDLFNISEIRTPVFESTELFARGVGDDTDIVNKEMYTFIDKGLRSITLRPELTAGIVRAYIEDGMVSLTQPLKLWYVANMYRYEKMQKGRYREFSQFGIEIFGSASYLADLEIINLCNYFLKKINIIDKVALNINSIGCSKCRPVYIEKLKEYLKPNVEKTCDNCKTRFNKNVLRVIDCKEEGCKKVTQNIPVITEHLCEDCKTDFENLKLGLDKLGIKYIVDSRIVRGLDYYNKTVFEFVDNINSLSIGGGGRYDNLVSNLGGNPTPAIGFAFGIDRLALLIEKEDIKKHVDNKVDLYFAIIEKEAYFKASLIANELREFGYKVEIDISDRSFKAQLKYANNIKAKFVVIVGSEEFENNSCNIKDMSKSEQGTVNFSVENIKEYIDNIK